MAFLGNVLGDFLDDFGGDFCGTFVSIFGMIFGMIFGTIFGMIFGTILGTILGMLWILFGLFWDISYHCISAYKILDMFLARDSDMYSQVPSNTSKFHT